MIKNQNELKNHIVVFSILILSAISCAEKPNETEGVFRYNEAAGISSLDPIYARSQASIWPIHHIFSTLVELDENLDIQPGLAYRWTIEDSVYTFFLRQNIKFHPHPAFADSQRLFSASDVVYSLERLRDPKWSSPGSWTMQGVKSITTLSDSVVEIVLEKPFSPFLRLLSMKYCSIVPHEAVDYKEVSFGESPSGTGAYFLKRWIPSEKMILRRNHNYYEKLSENGVESIVVRFIPDKLSAFLSFVKGDLDIISGMDVSYRDNILDEFGELQKRYQSTMKLETTAYLNTEYLAFNLSRLQANNSPYANPLVRQAIHSIIDKDLLVKYILKGLGTPANSGIIPPILHGAELNEYEYSKSNALALLQKAGYPNGKGLPELILTTNPGYQDMAEFVQNQASKVGIPIKVDVTPASALRQQMATGKIDFFRASWIADYPDPENYMLLFYEPNWPPNGPNYSRFNSIAFNELYEHLRSVVNGQQRDSLLKKMNNELELQNPIIPLFYDQVIRLSLLRVHHLPLHPLNLLDVRNVSLNP